MSRAIEAKLPWLREIVQEGPAPLFATVGGAHLYGFDSPDSDYDLRGVFVAPLDRVLRLRDTQDTLSVLEIRDGLELDWVAHDVLKFARMMTKRNGLVLEQLFSPLVVHGGPWLEELRAIGTGCVIRHLYHHYNGFFANQRQLLAGGDETVKRLLYCYRVVLAGIHVLRCGTIESSLPRLNEDFGIEHISELIERKRTGAEKGPLAAGEAATHTAALDALKAQLDAAFKSSTLPDEITSFDALDDLVVRARLELGH